MSEIKYYHHKESFALESGARLEGLTIAYHTYGTLNAGRDNVVWVCHALTANSDVADWWPHTVEQGCFLDPSKWFVVCANILGSHYGTTGPLSENPPQANHIMEISRRLQSAIWSTPIVCLPACLA